MQSFLITSNYRSKNKTVIWKLSIGDNYNLEKVAYLKIENNELLPNPYDHAAWGITRVDDGYVTAEANGLRLLDNEFNTIKRYQNTSYLRHLHDVSYINEKLYVANTGRDQIDIFDLNLKLEETVNLHTLPLLDSYNTVSKDNPTLQSDCFHVNYIDGYEGEIYFTLSFINRKGGRYNLKRKFPFIEQEVIQDNGLVYNLDQKEIFVNDIGGAHDGFWLDDKFWIVQTRNMSADIFGKRGDLKDQVRFEQGAIYRGLAVGSDYIIVGATRVDPNRSSADIYGSLVSKRGGQFLENTAILILDRSNFDLLEKIDLPKYDGVFPEVYKVITEN